MNSKREIYQALLDGETLYNVDILAKAKLNEADMLIDPQSGERADFSFSCLKDWQIYKEPNTNKKLEGFEAWFKQHTRKILPKEEDIPPKYYKIYKQVAFMAWQEVMCRGRR